MCQGEILVGFLPGAVLSSVKAFGNCFQMARSSAVTVSHPNLSI
jgi:hypothetical protein